MRSEVRISRLEFHHGHFLAMWLWARCSVSLRLIFHICKLGTPNVKGNMLPSPLNWIEDFVSCETGICEL